MSATTQTGAPARPGTTAMGLLRAMRPRQWTKNVLVLAAPFAAGALLDGGTGPRLAIAFAAFSLAASGIYLVNDARDVEADRAHPTKRERPIAAGVVPVQLALAVAGVLLSGAVALAALARWELAALLGAYVVIQLAYCLWLKHQPVFDICCVSAGFLLRAIAGGVATGIALSPWFLLVAGFGSLFMVTGKRYAERMLAERTHTGFRRSLEAYSASYLRFVWALSATVLVTTYSMWAFEIREAENSAVWPLLSIAPFVMAVLRYAMEVDRGRAGEPEEVVLGDRVLQTLAVVWIGTLGVVGYG
ncbi:MULTISPECIES: decaprenyl-phosphate phosphoribosyltransferase [Streptomyces]|nr:MULTISPECIES: decaprenyl-phosphate phosphoribosyltransferase [Streptomyces]